MEKFRIALSYLIVLLGGVVLAGWYTHTPELIQVFEGFAPMQYNTALGFVAIGLSFLFLNHGKKHIALIMGLVPLVLVLFQLGRMAPNTALCFALISLGLLSIIRCKSHLNKLWLGGAFSSLALAVGSVAFVGYLFKIEATYGWFNLPEMAFHTAVGVMISASVLCMLMINEVRKELVRPALIFAGLLTVFLIEIMLWEPVRVLKGNITLNFSTLEGIRIISFLIFLVFLFGITVYFVRELLRFSIVLDQAKTQAETSLNEKDILLRHLSHEIRNPLHAALGLLECIKDNVDNEHKESLNCIYSSCHHIFQVIENLFSITRVEKGELNLVEKPFDFDEWVKRVQSICSVVSSQYKLEFQFECTGSIEGHLIADATKLSQIVFNLCDNALKYTRKGSVRIQIATEQQKQDILLTIRVIDTGIGIPLDKQKEVFKFFGRAFDEHRGKGAGYGLAICKTYAEMMHGKIFFNSALGKGSTFIVQIPLKLDQAQAA